MNKVFYVCEHGGNPAECKDCKIKLLQDSLATQQEMTADLADELKIAETDLADVRRQERKACMALVNMSGKISGPSEYVRQDFG
jgi:septal ring factor EnvC (AmiA/AmiB activator)